MLRQEDAELVEVEHYQKQMIFQAGLAQVVVFCPHPVVVAELLQQP